MLATFLQQIVNGVVLGSLIGLIGVYAFQVGVFIADHRAGTLGTSHADEGDQE